MRPKPNFYRFSKSILAEGMAVNHWWTKDFDLPELEKYFGRPALIRGIRNAQEAGEIVPQEIIELFTELSS